MAKKKDFAAVKHLVGIEKLILKARFAIDAAHGRAWTNTEEQSDLYHILESFDPLFRDALTALDEMDV